MTEITICVGSLNPTKVNAVNQAFSRYFKQYKVYNIKAESKVVRQPIGLNMIIEGAINRARYSLKFLINAKRIKSSIYGVGIEAGLAEVPKSRTGFMDFQFCAIINENNQISLGSGIGFEYPQFVINQILNDKDTEIGDIIGNLAKNENLKNELGAISFLSKNVITRTEILTHAVICALLPFINKEVYNSNAKKRKLNA
ncbi:MAG: inosine/xanthosine triphosphatase [Promethearchaeota archaeon]|nr:MAG: inosine/xanthosine triphosphatase [Candidatus Lokiarchaeota archaeon]